MNGILRHIKEWKNIFSNWNKDLIGIVCVVSSRFYLPKRFLVGIKDVEDEDGAA